VRVNRCSAAVAAALALALLFPAAARAQEKMPARVQVHVGGDPALRERTAGCLQSALESSPDIVVAERDAEYVLSLIVLPIASGGFAMSAAVLSAHTDASLRALARLWALDDQAAERMRAVFRGAGALLDQRVLTGPDADALCRDVAAAFAVDTLARLRKTP
jgi:hypothetical protein